MKKLINLWFTNLPRQHTEASNAPGAILKWFIHPVKRRLAKVYLKFLRVFGLSVIGITGSSGKTTTKEMIASILARRGKTVWTKANIDPVYNIPTTIFRCTPFTKYLVLEMGIEFPGEMDYYLWLAKPDVGVVTNIAKTHTQYFGDLDGVRAEKIKLVQSLSRLQYAVLPGGETFLTKIAKKLKTKTVRFGKEGEVVADEQKLVNLKTNFTLKIKSDKINVRLSVPGEAFVQNALAAASVGYIYEASLKEIKAGLESFNQQEHRMNVFLHNSGALIVDDTYNSNPLALGEALKTFADLSRGRRRVLVLGDMLELGKYEKQEHNRIAGKIKPLNVDLLIGVGRASGEMVKEAKRYLGKKAVSLASADEVLPILSPFLLKEYAILIKASRSIGLEKVVSGLVK